MVQRPSVIESERPIFAVRIPALRGAGTGSEQMLIGRSLAHPLHQPQLPRAVSALKSSKQLSQLRTIQSLLSRHSLVA